MGPGLDRSVRDPEGVTDIGHGQVPQVTEGEQRAVIGRDAIEGESEQPMVDGSLEAVVGRLGAREDHELDHLTATPGNT